MPNTCPNQGKHDYSDAAGNLYATWDTQGTNPDGSANDIGWLSFSADHGATWSRPPGRQRTSSTCRTSWRPVPTIITAELAIANNGSLDGDLQGSQQQLSTDTTRGTIFFSDSTLWGNIAEAQGVGGDQWGVMNELWNFPGQVWLWLYAGMYQIPALNSNNANLYLDVGLLMIVFGFLLPMFAPWIPVINRIPRWIPLHKIIYRKYYASMAGGPPPTEAPGEPVPPPVPSGEAPPGA